MKESAMRGRVVRILRDRNLDPVAVENPVCPGTPDLNFLYGWIELKQLAKWPSSTDAIVLVPHFTPQQRVWLFRRRKAGGQAYVLIKIDDSWILLDGAWASEHLGRCNRAFLERHALGYWPDGLVDQELYTLLVPRTHATKVRR